jgi:hypothetical protein
VRSRAAIIWPYIRWASAAGPPGGKRLGEILQRNADEAYSERGY